MNDILHRNIKRSLNNNIIEVLRNNTNIIFSNNTSESHGKNYASGPYAINQSFYNDDILILKSGEPFPLSFILVDMFDNIIVDSYKYYQNIELHLDIEKINSTIDSKVSENRCFFVKENNIAMLNTTYMNVIIKECDNKQIKIIKNNYFYCEDPICSEDCPLNEEHAECIKNSTEYKNNKLLNKCVCIPGWKGINCQNKDYPDVHKYDCAIKFILKHSGVLLIIFVSSIYIANGCELGLSYGELEYLNTLKCSKPINSDSQLNNSLRGSDPTISHDKMILNSIEKELNSYRNKEKGSSPDISKKRSSNILMYNKGSCDNLDIKKVNQNSTEVRDYENKWIYECPLNRINLIFNIMEFLCDNDMGNNWSYRDNPEIYFNSVRREECLLHKSYFCGCIKSDTEYEIVQKYLEFYKLCSNVIEYSSSTGFHIITINNIRIQNSQQGSSNSYFNKLF
ncbi:hypothetical protein PIROE2DRAFT_5962 [Piromyces sp. E2]|nr:hypothetical protein PIROE2DRAFT_5962 [Piromyces sp. E2]|eukprot:OUM66750.1 hypothetical protein PIROE2DRAFT_5962 [Piromyces sp. E2]